MATCDPNTLLVSAAAGNLSALSGGKYLSGDALSVTLILLQQWWAGTDDAEAVLAAAAPNGFLSRSEGDYFLMLLALLHTLEGGATTGEALLAEAAVSGFTQQSEGDQAQITLALLRDLAGSVEDADTLLAAASAQKFTVPSRGDQWAMACQLLCEATGGTCDAETLMQEATTEGFVSLSKGDAISVLNQLLCNLVANADAEAFITRAGITDATQIAAVQQLVVDLKANGLWDKLLVAYPFVGGTAASHAQNLKSSDFTITWVGGVTHSASGVKSDGTTGYGKTGFIASVQVASENSCFLHSYTELPSSPNGCSIGAVDANRATMFPYVNGTNAKVKGPFDAIYEGTDVTFTGGNLLANRLSAGTKRAYSDAATSAIIAEAAVAKTAIEHYVLARNGADSPFSLFAFSLRWAALGENLPDAAVTTLFSIIETYQSALGRSVFF